MWERLRRFSAQDGLSQGLFLRAMVLLPLVSLSLRLRGFRATQTLLQKAPVVASTKPADEQKRVELTTRMVGAAVRHSILDYTCLEQSLALWRLLAGQGIASDVRIGIRKDEKFAAHAWVERNGCALNEPDAAHRHYAAFDAGFPADTPEGR